MKTKTIQVLWHGKDPVFSVDFHPTTGLLATGGGDKEIKFWKVNTEEDGNPSVEHLSSLEGHSRTVNVVRFSPSGDSLASGGDGGEVVLWRPPEKGQPAWIGEEDKGEHSWRAATVLRGHTDDVQDLAWSPDASAILTGGVENICIIWDMAKGKVATRIEDHQHFVQGVAWDPAGQYVVSQSADRTCRVYAPRPARGKAAALAAAGAAGAPVQAVVARARDMACAQVMCKRDLDHQPPAPAPAPDAPKASAGGGGGGSVLRHHLFNDENMVSFFRRPSWSPDGSFLVVPAGMHKRSAEGATTNTAYVYARGDFTRPAAHLPVASKPAVAVRFCPVAFRRLGADGGGGGGDPSAGGDPPAFDLPAYRLVFAVATIDSVLIYDTQTPAPIAMLSGMHYAAITDVAWSRDARYLAISSRDGYCTLAVFEAGELGVPAPDEELPAHVRALLRPAAEEAAAGAKGGAGRGEGGKGAGAKRGAEGAAGGGGEGANKAPRVGSGAPGQAVGGAAGAQRVTLTPQAPGGAAPAPQRMTLTPLAPGGAAPAPQRMTLTPLAPGGAAPAPQRMTLTPLAPGGAAPAEPVQPVEADKGAPGAE